MSGQEPDIKLLSNIQQGVATFKKILNLTPPPAKN
jgi:hypothetical protein